MSQPSKSPVDRRTLQTILIVAFVAITIPLFAMSHGIWLMLLIAAYIVFIIAMIMSIARQNKQQR